MIGDIVGKGGRRALRHLVPELRRQYQCHFCVANGENMAGGGGFNSKCLEELKGCGVDVFTSGDHVWDQREFVEQIDRFPQVLRPANVHADQPGRGWAIYPAAGGGEVGVINLLGRTFMNFPYDCPFRAAEAALAEIVKRTPIVMVDFHAEATSEKTAMARFLDGRVSAVLGTHTHVPTADEQILPGGTAFQCDVGMVGSRDSILGRAVEPVLHRFITGMPGHFTVVETDIRLQGTVFEVEPDGGRALRIERIVRDMPAETDR